MSDDAGDAPSDLDGWQDVLPTAITLAGKCHAPYLKAPPSVRRRFNQAVPEAVHVKDRKIARAEFSEFFASLFSRAWSIKSLKAVPRGLYSNSWHDLVERLNGLIGAVGLQA